MFLISIFQTSSNNIKSIKVLTLVFHISVFLIQITNPTFGQLPPSSINPQCGPEEKQNYFGGKKHIIGKDNSGYYTVECGFENSNETLNHYNTNLELVNSRELNLKKHKKIYQFILLLNNKICLFYFKRNIKANKFILYAETINKKTLSLNGDIIEIGESNFDPGREALSVDKYNYQLSADRTKILIYSIFFTKREEKEKIGLHVLDKEGYIL